MVRRTSKKSRSSAWQRLLILLALVAIVLVALWRNDQLGHDVTMAVLAELLRRLDR